MDLRKHTRAHSHLRIAYRSSSAQYSSYIHTLTNDISESGLNLNLDSYHSNQKKLDLILNPVNDRPELKCQARVIWCEQSNPDTKILFQQSGVEFINHTEETKNRLKELVDTALKEKETIKEVKFLERLTLLNENIHSRKDFIRASEQLSIELFGLDEIRLLLPERRIKTKEALKAWSKNLEISGSGLIIPVLTKGNLVGHLEVKNQSSKLTHSTLMQLKHWAGCLSAFCCSFLCGEE